jgi:hypothetical protein
MNTRSLSPPFFVRALLFALVVTLVASPGTAITAIVLLWFGPDALVSALKKKPARAGGGEAALVALALAGVLPMVDEVSRLTRG